MHQDRIFVGTEVGGVYSSDDSAVTWTRLTMQNHGAIRTLVAAHGRLYAGAVNAVFVSTDDGEQWVGLTSTGMPNEIKLMVPLGDALLVGNPAGLFKLSNNGAVWRWDAIGITNAKVDELASNGSTLYAATTTDVLRSLDGAQTWTPINDNLTTRIQVQFATHNNVLYASTNVGVFRFDDGNSTWAEVSEGLSHPNLSCIASSGAGTLFAGSRYGGVSVSADGGATWSTSNTGLANGTVLTLAVQDSSIYAGTEWNGFFQSVDEGESWKTANTGLPFPAPIYDVLVKDGILFAASWDSVYRSTDHGGTWESTSNGLPIGCFLKAIESVGNTLFVACEQAGVYRSTDFGNQWLLVNDGWVPFFYLTWKSRIQHCSWGD